MTTFTATFRTDADCAEHTFKAKTAEQALVLARKFYDERDEELLFQNYDGGSSLNEIEISGPEGSALAVWQATTCGSGWRPQTCLARLSLRPRQRRP